MQQRRTSVGCTTSANRGDGSSGDALLLSAAEAPPAAAPPEPEPRDEPRSGDPRTPESSCAISRTTAMSSEVRAETTSSAPSATRDDSTS